MADFKTALEALAHGTLTLDVLLQNIDKVLSKKPSLLNQTVAQLTDAYANGLIDAQTFAKLKAHAQKCAGSSKTIVPADTANEATVFAGDSGDVTQILTEAEKSRIADEMRAAVTQGRFGADPTASRVDFDLSVPSTPSTPSTPTGQSSWPTSGTGTGTGWTDPSRPQADGQPIGPNSVLKERFILDEVLGVGGMGTVYKGRDLIKVEARDKNPYVALKVLNEDFKKHPDSFIALQREASRQQKLAHPNIATVYDFDRTGMGGTVFLTMELLEGQPLNTYIKKVVKPKGGLPFEEAFPIIHGLGQALIYAHERNIVHSDFKPGNCFLLKNGVVKVLDFGIARAVKNPGQAEGEKTLFDPGKLGALTPAYASAEMLDGMDPIPPDDTYALACVAYELLTGRHPFNKLPANQARENKLAPAPIKILKRRQMKALTKGLAFRREDRSKTVQEFLTDLEGKTSPFKNPLIIGPAIVVLIAAIGVVPLTTYMHRKKIDQLIAEFKQGDVQVIAAKLEELPALEPDDKKKVSEEAKAEILAYFDKEINVKFDVQAEKYDYPAASKILGQAESLYPDSVQFAKLKERVEDNKNQLLSKLNDRYNQYLDAGKLLPDEKGEDIGHVLDVVKQIDREHPLLKDARLIAAYAAEADKALTGSDIARAKALTEAGLALAPRDVTLLNAGDKVKAALEKQQAVAQAADIQKRLRDAAITATSLDTFKTLHDDVVKLASINPDDPALAAVAEKIQPLIDGELTGLSQAGDLTRLEALRNDYSVMLGALKLKPVNEKIATVINETVAKVGDAQQQQALLAAQQKAIEDIKTRVAALLGAPTLQTDWESQVQTAFSDIETRLPPDDAWLKETHESFAKLYAQKAAEARQAQRFAEASNLLDRGERLNPGAPALSDEKQQLAQAEEAFKKAEEEKVRLAQIEGLKQTFLSQAKAKDVPNALKSLDELKKNLANDDSFLKKDVPDALSDAYIKLANSKSEAKDFAAALKFARAGQEVAPENQELKHLVKELTVEGNSAELRKVFATGDKFDVNAIQKDFDDIKGIDLQKYAALEKELVDTGVKRVNALSDKPEEHDTLIDTLQKLFPQNQQIVNLKKAAATAGATTTEGGTTQPVPQPTSTANPPPPTLLAEIDKSLASGYLSKVKDQLSSAKEFAGSPDLEKRQAALKGKTEEAKKAYDAFLTAFKAKNYSEADTQLAKAEAVWQDSKTLAKARDELEKAKGTPAAERKWTPIISDHPCAADLAGFGERKAGTCYELIAEKFKAPLMVVVPAGGKVAKPYAIGKYEVRVADYNAYCKLSGACSEVAAPDPNLPVTGVALKDAEAYAKWLSERTGKVYRLPTVAEWEYAAQAGGKQPKKDYNCRVEQGGQILKGQGLMGVNTGQPNGWGLYNYVGNVQEWATTGSSAVARGGDFKDKFGSCDISLEKPSDGKGDDVTGFRLVQELG